MIARKWLAPFGENADQSAVDDICADFIFGQIGQAQSGEGSRQHRRAGADNNLTLNAHP
jgi:hypothetical protein